MSSAATCIGRRRSLPTRMLYDLWLDDDGRVRRFQVVMSSGVVDSVVDVRIGEYGEPVVITAPAEQNVMPYSPPTPQS